MKSTVVFIFILMFLSSCSHQKEISDVPNIFLGQFCKNDVLSDFEYKLQINNRTIAEGSTDGERPWTHEKYRITKIIYEDWDKITIYALSSDKYYRRYRLRLSDGNVLVYLAILLDKSEDENMDSDQWKLDEEKIGILHKCDSRIIKEEDYKTQEDEK